MIACVALCKSVTLKEDAVDVKDIMSEFRVASLPITIPPFASLFVLTEGANAAGSSLEVEVIGPNGKPCFMGRSENAGPAYLVPLDGSRFEVEGRHKIRVSLNGEHVADMAFRVISGRAELLNLSA